MVILLEPTYNRITFVCNQNSHQLSSARLTDLALYSQTYPWPHNHRLDTAM